MYGSNYDAKNGEKFLNYLNETEYFRDDPLLTDTDKEGKDSDNTQGKNDSMNESWTEMRD